MPEAGDIKYVWEKSRFSFLYDIIRYDQNPVKIMRLLDIFLKLEVLDS